MFKSCGFFIKGGRNLLLCIVIILGLTIPAHAVLKAKWRYSAPNTRWVAEMQLPITAYSSQATEVVIDTATKYQTIKGWGGSPNEVGQVALYTLPKTLQDSVIKSLFDTIWGCRFNMIRLPIGCSDFSLNGYSLDDVDGDYAIEKISIDREKQYTLAFIKEALKVNPNIKVWGSPWTAPWWMKKNKNWFGGAPVPSTECELIQTEQIFTAYALYFSKAVTLYKQYGIPFFALSFQNEPYTCQPFPSMIWPTGAKMRDFMKNYLGPRMRADHPDVELWTPTMNLNDTNMYIPMLRDPYTSSIIKACCFQYQGKDVIAAIHQKFPNLDLWATELVCGGGDNTWDYAMSTTFPDVKYYIDNGAVGAFQWNLILEKNGRAGYTWNWTQNSMITMDTVAKTITFTSQYYCLKHFSYYMRPGSKLLKTTGSFAASQLTVKNPDGSIVTVARNNSNSARQVAIRLGNQMITAQMPALSFASFVFYDSSTTSTNNYVKSPVSGPNFINSCFKITEKRLVLPEIYKERINECTLFNSNGELVRKIITKNRIIDFSEKNHNARGIYFVRVRSLLSK